jgi:hypothetical protein
MGKRFEKLDAVKKKAVKDAELQARQKEKSEKIKYDAEKVLISEVIDTETELNAFYDTSVKAVEGYLKETKNPKMAAILKELKKIPKVERDEYSHLALRDEKRASDYFQKILEILERDERAKLKHGPEFIKNLGFAADVKFEEFSESKGRFYHYTVKKDHMLYELYFEVNGDIQLLIVGDYTNRFMSFYKSAKKRRRSKPIFKNVSLMELREDPSVFDFYLAPMEGWEYPQKVLDPLFDSFGELPKRSADEFIKFGIGFIKRVHELAQKIRKYSAKRNFKLSPSQRKKIIKQASALFIEVIDAYLSLSKEDQQKHREIFGKVRGVLYGNPYLIDEVLSLVKTEKQLKLIHVSQEDYAYLYSRIQLKRDKMKISSKLPAVLKKLPKKYQDLFRKLDAKMNFDKTSAQRMAKALKGIKEEAFREFESISDFLTGLFKNADQLITFTQYAKDLSYDEFEIYLNYYRNNKPGSLKNLAKLSKVLKKCRDLEDKRVVGMLIGETFDVKVIKKNYKKLKDLEKSGKNADYGVLDENPKQVSKILIYIEKLDPEYVKDSIWLFIKVFSEVTLTEEDFSLLNSLSSPQRTILLYVLRRSRKINKYIFEKFRFFLKLLNGLKSAHALDHLQALWNEEYKGFGTRVDYFHLYSDLRTASSRPNVWKAIESFKKKNPDKNMEGNGTRILDYMLVRDVPDDVIERAIPSLFKINLYLQYLTFKSLFELENAEKLLKLVVDNGGKFEEFTNSLTNKSIHSNMYEVYDRFCYNDPKLEKIPEFLDKLIVAVKNRRSTVKCALIYLIGRKTSNNKELFSVVENIDKPELINGIEKLRKKKFQHIGDKTASFDELVALYFHLIVSPKDLAKPKELLKGLEGFLNKADQNKYNMNIDRGYYRALTFLDIDSILKKEDTDHAHFGFILHVLKDSSPEFSKDKLNQWARSKLDDSNRYIRDKAAKLLIALGNNVQDFDKETLVKISEAGVDSNITRFELGDVISAKHIKFLRSSDAPKLPLSVYFSILINIEARKKAKLKTNIGFEYFKKLVKRYKEIENQPVYQNKVLVLGHDVNDRHYSHFTDTDAFNPESHKTFAEIQGSSIEILRHGKDRENVESMLSMLELTEGDLTIVLGGHGAFGSISFGAEKIDILKDLYPRLKKRLLRQKSGKPWKTEILFDSCISGRNIKEILMKAWKKDKDIKNHPVKMLSSSSEGEGSAKMALDTWKLKAKEMKKKGKILTWGDLYRDVESVNFVFSRIGYGYFAPGMSSNMTLFVDGEMWF